jgi:phytoene synthase
VIDETRPHSIINVQVIRESEALLARQAKSFRWASWFLPARMRRDASIVYAFCRMLDDAVDGALSPAIARHRLDEIKDMLRPGGTPDALVAAYLEAARRLQFGLEPAWELLAGVESDLDAVRIADDAELLTYCYRVAGTVGLMMCGVLGVTEKSARTHAVDLGIAMQLTNICRDVLEDAALGRVYLPKARLVGRGLRDDAVEPTDLLTANEATRDAVSGVVLGLLADAERLYTLGARGFPHIPIRPRLAIVVAATLYRAIGRRLRRSGGDALAGRTVVPGWHKVLLLVDSARVWLTELALSERPGHLLEAQADSVHSRRTHPRLP